MGADKMAKNDQKCWYQPGFEPGAFEEAKKVRILWGDVVYGWPLTAIGCQQCLPLSVV